MHHETGVRRTFWLWRQMQDRLHTGGAGESVAHPNRNAALVVLMRYLHRINSITRRIDSSLNDSTQPSAHLRWKHILKSYINPPRQFLCAGFAYISSNTAAICLFIALILYRVSMIQSSLLPWSPAQQRCPLFPLAIRFLPPMALVNNFGAHEKSALYSSCVHVSCEYRARELHDPVVFASSLTSNFTF